MPPQTVELIAPRARLACVLALTAACAPVEPAGADASTPDAGEVVVDAGPTSCASDADCPTTDLCAAERCVPRCRNSNDCDTDQRCNATTGRCIPRNPVPVGSACDANLDCTAAGTCLRTVTGGYCSQPCTSGCPDGTHCLADHCVTTCTGVVGCRQGLDCRDVDADETRECWEPEPLIELALGGPCESSTQCEGGRCLPETIDAFVGGYCSATCSRDADCGRDGACLALSDTSAVCAVRCTERGDCREPGYDCRAFRTIDDVPATICWSWARGGGGIGAPCTSYADCDGDLRGTCLRSEAYVDGYCTIFGCGLCPGGALCVSTGEVTFCADRCDDLTTCRDGYACTTLGSDEAICLPD